MKNYKKSSTICLLLGIILFLIGMIQPSRYEKAIEDGYRVDAVVTKVKEREAIEFDGGYTVKEYVVYGDYIVNGKTYTNVKIGTYGAPYHEGEIIPTVVNPDNPGKTMFEGGILATIGFVFMLVAIIWKIRDRKRMKAAQQAENT